MQLVEKDQKIEQINNEHAQEIQDVKQEGEDKLANCKAELKEMTMKATEFRMNLEATE